MIHPEIGPVDFNVDVLALPTGPARRLLAYVPADQPTMASLGHLLARSGSAHPCCSTRTT
jgi:hypothetical protein